ncbi:MAG: DUF4258 domain-containing protein [Deltaproteobacteria bacterium]|nr:DUF4258 domain-containing protein [Deltaproteobacteria bacterium]
MFKVLTPLGFSVRCSKEWWAYISTVKHPVLTDRLDNVVTTLTDPTEIRRSIKDPEVLLFYRTVTPRFVGAVVRKENEEGFLITPYPADSLKKGEVVWSASK